jgi:hypothetical protein
MMTCGDMRKCDILRPVQWACSLVTSCTGCFPAQRTHCCRDCIICRLLGCAAAQWCPLFTTITPARAALHAHSPSIFSLSLFVTLLVFPSDMLHNVRRAVGVHVARNMYQSI